MLKTIQIALKGAAMGIAEVIPGVSGGTIAFITGIYERLLNAIKSINPALIGIYKEGGVTAVWAKIDGTFLVKLFTGMALGFGLGLFSITHLLEHYPIHIWSFFFGLILASIPLVAKQINNWSVKEILLLLAGAVMVYWITIAAPSQGSENPLFALLSGVLAISALMLPGLSGSFVLLLLGMYTIIMPAIKEFIKQPFGDNTLLLLAFGAGMLIGLFSFARVLSWTFTKYKNQTLALLVGFLIGSLNKVWPWQQVLSTRTNSSGEEKVEFSKSVLPGHFQELTDNFLYGNDPHLFAAITVMFLGAIIVWGMDKLSLQEVE